VRRVVEVKEVDRVDDEGSGGGGGDDDEVMRVVVVQGVDGEDN
jgi:hypothetical protein